MFICGIICAKRLERHCNNQLHTNLSGLFLSFFLQFPQNTGEEEGGKKKKFLELVPLTYLCQYQVFKDAFIFRMNFQNINNSIKQNQAIKKDYKTTVPRLYSKAEQRKQRESFC